MQSCDKAIALKSDYAEAYNNRGNALNELKRFDEGLQSCDKAIALKSDYADAYNNRGNALNELKRFDEALQSYDKAIALKPDNAAAYNNRGNVLKELKRLDEALQSYDKAIALKSDYADAYNNRGNALNELKRLDEALQSYDKAIALKLDNAEAYINRGIALHELKRLDEALQSYDKAIALKSDYADAYWNKSLLKILVGEYLEGWQLYEWRRKNDNTKNNYPNYAQPLWTGNDALEGKTILVHSEQGLGDSIQFCRYLTLLKALNPKEIVFNVEKTLVPILSSLDKDLTIVEKNKPLPPFDYYCPLLSLPLAFKTTVETIPAKVPYLYADLNKQKIWQRKLGEKNRPRIGLVWSGSTGHENDHNRSLVLKQLSSLLKLPFEFHSLQKEVRQVDLNTLSEFSQIKQHQDELHDFSDTAALIDNLDIVISVDTSVAHLAGALGKQVWIMLPFMPDSRWMLDSTDTPWYPTATLFRQPKIDDWDSVIKNIEINLQKLCKSNALVF